MNKLELGLEIINFFKHADWKPEDVWENTQVPITS